MIVVDRGHSYRLSNLKSKGFTNLKFYKDSNINSGKSRKGTSNQEVLRVLIDRVQFLDMQKPHTVNSEIIYHLRKALILHEMRHLDRMIDKDIEVEKLPLGDDGHLRIK